MPRRPRRGTAGLVFHVMNRAARRLPLFQREEDYAAFLAVLCEAQERIPLRILCYVLMPNHWHLVLWPSHESDLSRFMSWATGTHAPRWHLARCSVGNGTIYQGRYKAIAIKDDEHFLTVCRYVERNPVKARLVEHAADWPWSSASSTNAWPRPALAKWPVPPPPHWRSMVDGEPVPGEFDSLREAIRTNVPFGPAEWRQATAKRLGWTCGLQSRGRPQSGSMAETENTPDPSGGGSFLERS